MVKPVEVSLVVVLTPTLSSVVTLPADLVIRASVRVSVVVTSPVVVVAFTVVFRIGLSVTSTDDVVPPVSGSAVAVCSVVANPGFVVLVSTLVNDSFVVIRLIVSASTVVPACSTKSDVLTNSVVVD